MKARYYPETDSLYIELKEDVSVESYEISDGLVVDVDNVGAVLGLEIEHLSCFTTNSGAQLGLEIHRRNPADNTSVTAFGVDFEVLRDFVEGLAIQERVDDLAGQLA